MLRRIRSTGRRVAAITIATALCVGGAFATTATPAGAACPTFGATDRWIGGYTLNGAGSNWAELSLASSGSTVSGSVVSLNGSPPNTNTLGGTLSCNTFTGVINGVLNVPVNVTATLLANGDELVDGIWTAPGSPYHGTWSSARVLAESSATNATELTTDPDSSGATPSEPLQVGVTSPTAGDIEIGIGHAANPILAGYQLLDQVVHIEAPQADISNPLVFSFVLDAGSLLGAPVNEVAVLRNGAAVLDCDPGEATAAFPDPCVASRTVLPGGDVQITVRTSSASIWTFGVNASRGGFHVRTTSLPGARLGVAYSATLTAVGGTTPYKWKKLTKLPKGLKIKAKTGVLSGTPKKARGTFVVRLQVIDKAKPKQVTSKTFTLVVT